MRNFILASECHRASSMLSIEGRAIIPLSRDARKLCVKNSGLQCPTGDKLAEKLITAVRPVDAGQRWIPKEVASRLASRNLFEELTPRELQIRKELAKGLANKQIADALNITEYTAKDHLKNILTKLHVADRTEAVAAAIQRGIIRLG